MTVSYDAVEVGTELPEGRYQVRRVDLIRYAGASGDFNPIHWSERTARSVGLPNVIAHGMYTMALAGRALTDWTGDPGSVREFGVRFTKPVPVPDDDTGTEVVVTGRVAAKLDDRQVRVDLVASCAGEKVLGQARAVVALP
ncbi:MAG: MaoC family dehydratase [Sporichthyaceae bacterium]|nr:MaoC family dehydratase [Sporichthyaceae bacterium]